MVAIMVGLFGGNDTPIRVYDRRARDKRALRHEGARQKGAATRGRKSLTLTLTLNPNPNPNLRNDLATFWQTPKCRPNLRNDLATFWQTPKCRAPFCPAPKCPDPLWAHWNQQSAWGSGIKGKMLSFFFFMPLSFNHDKTAKRAFTRSWYHQEQTKQIYTPRVLPVGLVRMRIPACTRFMSGRTAGSRGYPGRKARSARVFEQGRGFVRLDSGWSSRLVDELARATEFLACIISVRLQLFHVAGLYQGEKLGAFLCEHFLYLAVGHHGQGR